MAPKKPNTTLCHSNKYNYNMVVIPIFFIHLVCLSFTAATNFDNFNGGFNAHLIRRDSPNSPLYNHKRNKVFWRLMSLETPQSALKQDLDGAEFLMKFSIGTPPFDVYAIADTGSSITWTQCQPVKNWSKTKNDIFDPRKSWTYRNITCQESECGLVDNSPNKNCENNPQAACMFSITYENDSYSEGEMTKEVIILKSTSSLKISFLGAHKTNQTTLG